MSVCLINCLDGRFQSTPPARGATPERSTISSKQEFQSTPPARGATSKCFISNASMVFQSTPPARGATGMDEELAKINARFQSTPPARGATEELPCNVGVGQNFNPRPPRGGRLDVDGDIVAEIGISIHAPREGGDRNAWYYIDRSKKFQSTPPARGATARRTHPHAQFSAFQSTPPARGATGLLLVCVEDHQRFQSTPPARGATDALKQKAGCHIAISIHAPREGGDQSYFSRDPKESLFQSTPPARGATLSQSAAHIAKNNFNPRPPRGGRHKELRFPDTPLTISIHAPREGGDHHRRVLQIHA